MIDITLRFSTVAEAAAAINQLNGAQQAAVTSVVDSAKTETKTAPGKSKAEKAAADAASAAAAQSQAQQPAADAKASEAADKPKAIPYTELQAAVFKLAGEVTKKGVDKDEWVLSIAKKHGGENFKALKPEVYAAALADVNEQIAKLAALEEAVA
jgi:hypothetical protein